MLKIVTDGGADMPENWLEDYQIHMLPLYVRFGERSYLQGVDIDQSNFYKLVAENKIIPKTSLPSPQQIIDFYQKISKKGDEILSVHLGSKLSGTYSVVQMAAKELENDINVTPFDSGAGSAALGFMCREARNLSQKGFSVTDIIKNLEIIKRNLEVIFTLDTLEFAYLNGRISYIQNALTSLLNIKPIIVLRDGLLQMSEKVRTRRHSINRVIEIMQERIGERRVSIAVVHAADYEMAQIITDRIKKLFNYKDLIITDLSIPVAANLGPGAIGIVAFSKE
jgi:DegV family protein with EDD domain